MAFCRPRARILRSSSVLALVIAAATASYGAPAGAQATAPATTPATTPAPKKDAAPSKPAAKDPKADAKAAEAAPASTAPAKASEPAPAAAAKPVDEDEKQDVNGIYLSGDFGFTRADIGGFSDSTGLDKTGANGFLAGFGAGYRRSQFKFGARFRDHATTQFALWAIMGEIGYSLKMHPVSPSFNVHVGYMFDTGVERGAFEKKLPAGNFLTPDIDINGVVVGGELGANYVVSHNLKMGPFLGFDISVLHRSQPDPPQTLFQLPADVRNNALFGQSGDGLGYILSIGLRVTADIGIDAAFAPSKPAPAAK